jgi:hypothetical protein
MDFVSISFLYDSTREKRVDRMKPKITREALEQSWSDPVNWRYGLIYYCKEDPRVWVPKRQKWRGWTLNFAHPLSIPALIFSILFATLPLYFLAVYGFGGAWIWFWWAVLLAIVVSTCLACWYWSSPGRYGK